jgi:hypothetical protein
MMAESPRYEISQPLTSPQTVAVPSAASRATPSAEPDDISWPNTTPARTITDPTARSTWPVRMSIAPGTEMIPMTATCSRITLMFEPVRKRSLADAKYTTSARSAKKRPLRCVQLNAARRAPERRRGPAVTAGSGSGRVSGGRLSITRRRP